MKWLKSLAFGLVVLFIWIGAVGALFSSKERDRSEMIGQSGDSAAVLGDTLGTVILGVVAVALPIIFGAWLYRRYNGRQDDDKQD